MASRSMNRTEIVASAEGIQFKANPLVRQITGHMYRESSSWIMQELRRRLEAGHSDHCIKFRILSRKSSW